MTVVQQMTHRDKIIITIQQQQAMTQNSFFLRNTIRDLAAEQPVQLRQRSKRALSVATLRMNPAKFQHREVFDGRLYEKSNFFKLDLQELKQKEQAKGFTPSRDLAKAVTALAQLLEEQALPQIMANFNNHCALMHKNEVKKEFTDTVTGIVISFLRKIYTKTEELAAAKSQAEQRVADLESSLVALRKQSAKALEESQRGRKGEREKQLREANNHLDFSLKREMLKVDSLEEKLRDQGKALEAMAAQLRAMQAEREAQTSYREGMEYKVKRLKEELQVAHILKEQNLADKMKYIMNW